MVSVNNWFLMALLAPFLWSLVVLLDVYFVHQVYKKAHEGTVISGLFQGCVVLLVPFVGFTWPGDTAGLLFVAGGVAFIASFHWYFKSMFLVGDGALVQILWNLTTIIVPVFAWAIAGESLSLANYAGVAIAFVGGTALAWDGKIEKKDLFAVSKMMIPAILLLSFSMVLQKRGYEIVGDHSFWPGFFLFSFGVVIGGMLVFLIHNERKNLLKRVGSMSWKYLFIFFLAECLSVSGTLASQKAISLAPGVSLVAVIESLVPVFVMMNSLLAAVIFRNHAMGAEYSKQTTGIKSKVMSIVFIAAGIYLVA